MAVFIELVTDAFEQVFSEQARANQNSGGGARSSRAGKTVVRRPVRGIETKTDSYAYIKVVMANGVELPLLDSSSYTGTNSKGYTNFILQSVQEQRMEKHQIVETFGDAYVFFFGESPRFLDCQAMLINSHDFNWRAEWWHNYEKYLRGTKLVELGARCYLFWDDNVVEGYMLMASAVETSEQPYTVQLQFRFFVTKYQNINLSHVEQFPVRSSVQLPSGVDLTQPDAFDKLQAYYRGDSAGTGSAASREAVILGDAPRGGEAEQKITRKIRELPPSIVVDPSIWSALRGTTGMAFVEDQDISTVEGSSKSVLRGLIAENIDEYVNGNDGLPGIRAYMQGATESYYEPYYELNKAITRAQELSYSLPYSVITTLNALGVSADNADAMRSMGLAPNFSPGYTANASAFASARVGFSAKAGASVGARTSFGGSSSASVSFSPIVSASVGASAGVSIGASARAGYYSNASASYNSSYTNKDPMGSIYGRAGSKDGFSADAHKYEEGAGYPSYGYSSPYGGAGYGHAGFGDFGGTGFGSANASGDPGFRDPNSVVSRQRASAQSKQDSTSLTPGASFGGALAAGTASVSVGGSCSAFSTTVLYGSFSSWVAEAARQQQGTADVGYEAQRRSQVPPSQAFVASASAQASASFTVGFS